MIGQGNEIEWRGAWSDSSYEWNPISAEVKNALEYRRQPDGEFWMNYDDFYRSFETVQFCELTPDAFSTELLKTTDPRLKAKLTWKLTQYDGEWLPGKSSGGCGKDSEALYWTNPQFLVRLTDVDPYDNENKATIIVSLMQKYTREKRIKNRGDSCEEFIQFRLYRILNASDADKAKKNGQRLYASQLERCSTSGSYINLREVTKRFRVLPGDYLIIPSCYDANIEGQFLLRLYTENPINENNASVLTDHKAELKDEDIFFTAPKSINDAFSSWSNLLGEANASRSAAPQDTSRSDVSSSEVSKSNANLTRSHLVRRLSKHISEFNVYISGDVVDELEKVDIKKDKNKLNKHLFKFL
jgi:hypothetical protein